MMKKLVIGLFAVSSIFISVPAFSATQAEIVAQCKTAECVLAVQAYLAGLPAAQRVQAARDLAAALAQEGLNAGPAKANFTAALSAVSQQVAAADPALSQQIAQLSQTLSEGGTIQTAALVNASAN